MANFSQEFWDNLFISELIIDINPVLGDAVKKRQRVLFDQYGEEDLKRISHQGFLKGVTDALTFSPLMRAFITALPSRESAEKKYEIISKASAQISERAITDALKECFSAHPSILKIVVSKFPEADKFSIKSLKAQPNPA